MVKSIISFHRENLLVREFRKTSIFFGQGVLLCGGCH